MKRLFKYFFDFTFRKAKKRAISELQKHIDKYFSDRTQFSALFQASKYIKTITKAYDIKDIDQLIRQEINKIVDDVIGEYNIIYFDPKTNWIMWDEVLNMINHSALDNTKKDELENLVIVLRIITRAFDMSSPN